MTPGVVVIAVVVIVGVSYLLIRLSRRGEAAAPAETRVSPAVPRTTGAKDVHSHALVTWLLERANEQTGVNVAGDSLARQRVEEAAAKAMQQLRSGATVSINLPFLVADAKGPKHFEVRFTRNVDSTFELQ